jgi:hypothetical protein
VVIRSVRQDSRSRSRVDGVENSSREVVEKEYNWVEFWIWQSRVTEKKRQERN